MKVKVLETIRTARGYVPPGRIIDIPHAALERLVGKVQPLPFDTDHWRKILTDMVEECGRIDPGTACWEWISQNRLSLLSQHLAAVRAADASFQMQDGGNLEKAVAEAQKTFRAATEAFANRYLLQQPQLIERGTI